MTGQARSLSSFATSIRYLFKDTWKIYTVYEYRISFVKDWEVKRISKRASKKSRFSTNQSSLKALQTFPSQVLLHWKVSGKIFSNSFNPQQPNWPCHDSQTMPFLYVITNVPPKPSSEINFFAAASATDNHSSNMKMNERKSFRVGKVP